MQSLSCQSAAAASNHQACCQLYSTLFTASVTILLPSLLSAYSFSLSFVCYTNCSISLFRIMEKQEFMLDTHLIKASCEDCSAACGHFRLLDWALANQLILDWAYCEDYSFASNLINLNSLGFNFKLK
ncbi:hypothetical protein NC651_016140 [Populus alba x Populus x berolinensis]|nr:hypothetical protein NC651_016140 [Populus alba x Populus x berolinensis]